jgi:hypothetical protein
MFEKPYFHWVCVLLFFSTEEKSSRRGETIGAGEGLATSFPPVTKGFYDTSDNGRVRGRGRKLAKPNGSGIATS